jgi:hypothetical protein
MPPITMITKDFMKSILCGEKKLLKMSEVNFCNPPTFDEIAVVNLYKEVIASPGMAELFPDHYPKGRQCCRAYMFNCWNTLHPETVSKVIKHAFDQRFSTENDKIKANSIKITETWREELDKMPFVSKQKGRMSFLLKQKSKIGVVVRERKKYDHYDFGKKIKANDG